MVDTAYLGKQDPNINTQLLTAQQQLALAQALRGQSMQPIQAPGGQNGRISPLSVLAQALGGYQSSKMMGSATQDLATAQSAQAQAQARMLMSANSEDGPPAAAPAQAQAPAPAAPLSDVPQSALAAGSLPQAPATPATPAVSATPATPAAPASDSAPEAAQARALRQRGGALEALGLGEKAKALYDQAGQIEARIRDRSMPAPTDTEKMLLSQGIQRGTPAWNNAMGSAVTKANYLAPVQVGQGNVALDPATNKPILQNPKMADGVTADFSNPTAPTASAMPGYAGANAGIVGAAEKAKADNAIRDVTLPDGSSVPMRAGPAAAAGGAQAGLPPYTGNPLPPQELARYRAAARAGNKDAQMLVTAYDQAQPRLGADPTVQKAREGQQVSLSEKWKPLNDAASSVQTVNARLDTISDLAKRASVGPLADKVQYANSLLSLAGSDKATDATTAKALLDKNANQIVAQLGQGGLGTDAARSILGAAYPNSKMPAPAIQEAAENLKAVNNLTAAKARVLQPHYLKNDPAAYQQAESQFNAVADPRVFQWYGMHDPAQQAAYAKKMVQQDPQFRAKVQALTDMGALK